jgi:hypothetical protein
MAIEGFSFIDILKEIKMKRDFASFLGRRAPQAGLVTTQYGLSCGVYVHFIFILFMSVWLHSKIFKMSFHLAFALCP